MLHVARHRRQRRLVDLDGLQTVLSTLFDHGDGAVYHAEG
jgi:hypothetical protein